MPASFLIVKQETIANLYNQLFVPGLTLECILSKNSVSSCNANSEPPNRCFVCVFRTGGYLTQLKPDRLFVTKTDVPHPRIIYTPTQKQPWNPDFY